MQSNKPRNSLDTLETCVCKSEAFLKATQCCKWTLKDLQLASQIFCVAWQMIGKWSLPFGKHCVSHREVNSPGFFRIYQHLPYPVWAESLNLFRNPHNHWPTGRNHFVDWNVEQEKKMSVSCNRALTHQIVSDSRVVLTKPIGAWNRARTTQENFQFADKLADHFLSLVRAHTRLQRPQCKMAKPWVWTCKVQFSGRTLWICILCYFPLNDRGSVRKSTRTLTWKPQMSHHRLNCPTNKEHSKWVTFKLDLKWKVLKPSVKRGLSHLPCPQFSVQNGVVLIRRCQASVRRTTQLKMCTLTSTLPAKYKRIRLENLY